MSNTEFIGYLAVYGIVFLAGIIGLIKPIITLNVNIQKLSDSIDKLSSDTTDMKSDLEEHKSILDDHEKRIIVLEHKGGTKHE